MTANLVLLVLVAVPPAETPEKTCPPLIEEFMTRYEQVEPWALVLLLDVVGDPRPEIFVADTSRGGNAGEPWVVYRRNPDGTFQYFARVFFHPLGFRIDGSLLVTYSRSNAVSGQFITYRISEDSITKEHSTGLLYDDDPEYERRLEEILAWGDNLRGSYFGLRKQAVGDGQGKVACQPLWQ